MSRLQFSAASDRGKVRSRNEDTYCVRMGRSGVLAAVADGMGGMRAGNVASRLAIDALTAAFEGEALQSIDLAALFAAINNTICKEAGSSRMGTTLTAVRVLAQGQAFFAHVGDSRLYHFGADGLRRLTDDHSLVEELARSGGLSASQDVPRHLLTRAVGVSPRLRVDTGVLTLAHGERLLLCTDGVSQYVQDDELQDALKRPLQGLAEELVRTAIECGGTDNATAIVLQREGATRVTARG